MKKRLPAFPHDEVVDRLYHRQDPKIIAEDLLKRDKIERVDYDEVLLRLEELKNQIESLRIK